MTATVSGIHLGLDTHANRPAANTVPDGSLYSCSDHALIYKSNLAGNSWATWGDLSGPGTTFDPDEHMPWHIPIVPMIWTPDATAQGTWAGDNSPGTNTQVGFPFYVPGSVANSGTAQFWANNATGAQNDAFAYDIVLAAGTWDCHAWVRKSTNTGIITLQQDGADQGTADTYAAAAAAAKVSVTGFTVATTGKKRMNFKMATKNASSSGYFLGVFAIEFRRTA